jgi:hypothetical protein
MPVPIKLCIEDPVDDRKFLAKDVAIPIDPFLGMEIEVKYGIRIAFTVFIAKIQKVICQPGELRPWVFIAGGSHYQALKKRTDWSEYSLLSMSKIKPS